MHFHRSAAGLFFLLFYLTASLPIVGMSEAALHFDHLGRNEGLSQNSVNCMIRDSKGFLWMGTEDGLNRYDGKRIRVFQNDPGNPATLSNNYVLSMCEDEEGVLWIGTMAGGLNKLNSETGKFRVFRSSGTENSLSENNVWSVIPDKKGNIWAGTSVGLNRYDKKTGKFKIYRHITNDTSSLISDMVISLWLDTTGMIWVGTTEGLCRFDPVEEKFIPYVNKVSPEMKDENIIWSVTGDSSGKIFTGTNNGAYALDPVTKVYTPLLKSESRNNLVVWSVFACQNGIVWAGTAQGLYRIQTPDGSFDLFRHHSGDIQSLSDDNVWCILTDPSGNIWAGTKKGVSKARTYTSGFRLLSGDSGKVMRLSSSKVMTILEDSKGRLWIGTDGGGLNCISPDRKSNTIYNTGNSALRNNAVWALAEDKYGNIWIGNYLGGLHVLHSSGGKIEALPLREGDPYALHNNRVLVILPGDDSYIWIGTRNGGLVRFDLRTKMFKNYMHCLGDTTSITSNTILSLAFDQNKQLLAGLQEGGLNRFNPVTEKFTAYRKNSASGLSDDNVWAILPDKNGRLWIGTQGGLNYSEQSGQDLHFHYLGTQDGLSGNMVFGLLEDSLGNIWCSSFNGLSRLNFKVFESLTKVDNGRNPFESPLFRNFDTSQGLQGIEFNQGAAYKDRKGTLYFGGTNGLNYFSTSDIRESNFVPPVLITGFRIFNREVSVLPSEKGTSQGGVKIVKKDDVYYLPREITDIKELTLTYRESVISFDFAAMDFSQPEKNQYAYKLAGFDKDWNFIGARNSATYTNLNPGEYILLVKGSNSDGIWNPEETTLKLTIIPPFWLSFWFFALLVLLVVFGIWSIFNDQKKKARKEKELIELQLKTIKSQMDPHFAFNALNTVASFIYAGDPDATYDYFTRFASLIRNILKDHDRISRPLQEEIVFVKNYLELQKIRFREKFTYDIQVAGGVSLDTQVPTMIIQSYAENAVKHGLMHRTREGLLNIRILKKESCIQITIEDNGIGRVKAAELNTGSTGMGLKMMDQIIALHRKLYRTAISQTIEDLVDDQGIASGTRVTLTICSVDTQKRDGLFSFKSLLRKYNEH